MDKELYLAGVGCVLSRLFDPDSLLLEQLDEKVSDDLPLRLGLADALESLKEYRRTVDDGQVDAEMFLECLLDLLAFIETHHTIIHENGVESVA